MTFDTQIHYPLKDKYLNEDVVIPKNGGGKEHSYTEGFHIYTQLVNEVCDEYTQLSPKLKRQFVIDNIITPLLNEQRNFYRYDRKKKGYVMVDLSDDKKLIDFTTNVVMQKVRDIMKPSSKEFTCKRKQKECGPTVKSEPKKQRATSYDNDNSSTVTTTTVYEEQEDIDNLTINLAFDEDDHSLATTFSVNEIDFIDFTDLYLFKNGVHDIEEKSHEETSKLRPLINILCSHTDAEQLINCNIVKEKFENGLYDSIEAFKKDLMNMFTDALLQNGKDDNGVLENKSRDLQALITNYCKGLKVS
jgi:hypothetical protein